jgi:hypothetical protein
VVAAAALLLDRAKVPDDVPRYVLAGLAFALVVSLVATGRYAAGATLKIRSRRPLDMVQRFEEEWPESTDDDDDARLARHLRNQIEDLLLAADRLAQIDHDRSRLLLRARAFYYLSLILLVALGAALLVIAFVMDPPAQQP